MNNIVKKLIEAAANDNDNKNNMEEKFFAFIFQNNKSFQDWLKLKPRLQSTCGAFISEKELSFQCFTCGKEPTHMFCKNCFVPQLHKDHQCIIDVKNKGLCDCGIKSIISNNGFCSKHNDQIIIRKKQEINKIPIQLQNNITLLFQQLFDSYRSLMKKIKKKNVSNLQITVLALYHYAKHFKDQGSIEILESYQENESIYVLFRSASNLNTLIFKTIEKLIDQRLQYSLFIQQILTNKNLINSKYTIIEKLLRYYIYIEVYQSLNNYRIDKILYQLFIDEEFKACIFSIILKNFSKFWLINQFKTTNWDQVIEKQLQYVDQSIKKNKQKHLNQKHLNQKQTSLYLKYFKFLDFDYERIEQYIKPLINDLQNNPLQIHFVYSSKILKTESQFVSFEMQEQFFSQNQNIQDLVVTIQKLNYTSGALCSNAQLKLPQLFKQRFEYKNFGEIALGQLQNILSKNFQEFKQIDITIDLIKEFNFNKFAITNLINSLGQGIEMKNQSNIFNNQIILADTIHYIQDQATYYTAICTGLHTLFSNKFSNEIFEKNIIKLLFYQTYFILKKTIRINYQSNRSSQFQSNDLLKIKNGMIIQKLFISYLSYLYCVTQFENGKQFLLYLIDILDEDQQEFENILNLLLEEIMQVYLILNDNENQKIKSVYQGTENHMEYSQFHRIDTCFIKLYIFLFDVNGFSRFQNMMEEFYQSYNCTLGEKQLGTIIQQQTQEKYNKFQQMFINLIVLDYDLYNVCCPLLTQLTNDLKLSLVRIVGNYFIISTQMEYQDIQQKLKNFGVLITSNFSKHILQICEVDQTTKKLKLKVEYKIFYEPSLIQNQSQLYGQIQERLFEQKKSDSEILLGNGITWDIEQFSNKNYRVLMHQVLKIYCHFELFLKNLVYLLQNRNLIQQQCYLIYAQIAYLNQFDQQLFKQYFEIVIIQLEEIQQQNNLGEQQNQQKIKVLIQSINELNQEQTKNNVQKTIKQKFQIQKEQYKAKFNKIQSSNLIQEMLDKKEQNEILIKEEDQCSTCKLDFTTSNSVGMMNIYLKSSQQLFNQRNGMLKEEITFDLDLGIQTCKHYFHDQCLSQIFNSHQMIDNIYGYGLNQRSFDCPICKFSANCRFPIQQIDNQKVKSLNTYLSKIYYNLKIEPFLNQEITIAKIYISLFYDLLISLFINPQNYKKTQKNILFNQLLQCFYQTILDMDQNNKDVLPQIKNIQNKNNFLMNILSSICEIYMKQCSLNQLRLSITQLIGQYRQLSQDEISLLISSFGIEEKMMIQIISKTEKQCIHDTFLEYYQTFQTKAIQFVQNNLGQTFLEFHSKYFSNKCKICKFYNQKKSKNSGVTVCLLCQDLFCNEPCSEDYIEDIHYHVKIMHNENSIFVNLQDGSVTLINSYALITRFKYLYYNSLGEKINIEDPNSDWNEYKLDITKANELADIIVNNAYSKIIKSQKNKSFYH
ncbi:unnamed protein product [Paramecium primaurelia]|uniref:UBR-type domain-containing protein n=1 Tax=Paramecium primaurelia TaxID=5886 RepID=A0A8S1NL25_PARPR|nr:unnamed protein product [Paramecium primaurelia]